MTPASTPKTTTPEITVFNFTADTPADAWQTQNDTVMGGRSDSKFSVTDDGHGRFTGHVSLKNNGGFASIQHRLDEPVDVSGASSFQLRIKGDGKDYTFRVKSSHDQQYHHQATFPTKTIEEWETISIPFASMKAKWRGRDVDVPNFQGDQVVHLQLLIGNKEEQDFAVEVDVIEAL